MAINYEQIKARLDDIEARIEVLEKALGDEVAVVSEETPDLNVDSGPFDEPTI